MNKPEKKAIQVSLPAALIEMIDQVRKIDSLTRSYFIEQVLKEYLKFKTGESKP